METLNTVIYRPVEHALPNLKMIPNVVPKFLSKIKILTDRLMEGPGKISSLHFFKGTRINMI